MAHFLPLTNFIFLPLSLCCGVPLGWLDLFLSVSLLSFPPFYDINFPPIWPLYHTFLSRFLFLVSLTYMYYFTPTFRMYVCMYVLSTPLLSSFLLCLICFIALSILNSSSSSLPSDLFLSLDPRSPPTHHL